MNINIKALFKSLFLRKFTTILLLLQVAITLGLIVNSAILAFDTRDKLTKPVGISLDGTLFISHHPTSGAYKDLDYRRSITLEDMEKLRQISGVKSVSITNQLPIQSRGMLGNVYDLENPELEKEKPELRDVAINLTDKNLADALGFELVEGRFLDDSDELDYDSDKRGNVVITDSLRQTLYGDGSALGRELNNGRVVGVIKDYMVNPGWAQGKQFALFQLTIMKYIFIGRYYVLNVEPGQMDYVRNQVTDVILGVQAERDIFKVFTLGEHFENFYENDKGLADLFVFLCGLMVLVTAISSYGYAQYHVTQQKKFIGIRRALGATRKDILLYVLTETWLVTLVGFILGIAVTIGINILLSHYIELSKPEVMGVLLATTIIFLASTIATWLPAMKTSKIAPVVATKTV